MGIPCPSGTPEFTPGGYGIVANNTTSPRTEDEPLRATDDCVTFVTNPEFVVDQFTGFPALQVSNPGLGISFWA
jgi:hypothetical protein